MISMPPKLSSVALINWAGNAGSVTSPLTTIAFPPAVRIAAAVSSAGAGSRSLTTTAAPSAPNNLAVAAPIPRPAPVKIATLPSIKPMNLSPLLRTVWQRRYKRPCNFHIAILIGCLQLAGDTCLAISFVFFGNCARAANLVTYARHPFKACIEFAQRGWPNIIAQQLSHETHNQHPVSDDAAYAERLPDLGIGMQRIKVTRCACVSYQLQVCNRPFDQPGELISHLHIFVIELCRGLSIGCHMYLLFVVASIYNLFLSRYNYLARTQQIPSVLVGIANLVGEDIHR